MWSKAKARLNKLLTKAIAAKTMPNMSYCRFSNTLSDLRDCANHLDDELSEEEAKARAKLIRLCQQIARGDYGGEVEEDE